MEGIEDGSSSSNVCVSFVAQHLLVCVNLCEF